MLLYQDTVTLPVTTNNLTMQQQLSTVHAKLALLVYISSIAN
jgi:hypothetical protein